MDHRQVMELARQVDQTRLRPDDILVTGQTAVVTGGGAGIGQGVALGLARFGASVAVLDIDPDRCRETTVAIERLGARALGVRCDVTDADGVRDALAQVEDELGVVTILVNNAGGVREGAFLTQPEPSMRRHIDINLVSMLVATQQVARRMVDSGRSGSIVNVSSIEGSRAAPGFAVYAACKAGMISFTKTMALELGEHGIRVNCISPDHTVTAGMRGNRSGPVRPQDWPDSSPDWAKLIPLGREGLVDECAAAVIWLASPMAGYVTGVNLPVDGGTFASSGWLRNPAGGWHQNP